MTNLFSIETVTKIELIIMQQQANPKPKYCFAYQEGNCQRGDSCKFQHSSVSPLSPKKTKAKEKLCYAHMKGDCERGDSHSHHSHHDGHNQVAESSEATTTSPSSLERVDVDPPPDGVLKDDHIFQFHQKRDNQVSSITTTIPSTETISIDPNSRILTENPDSLKEHYNTGETGAMKVQSMNTLPHVTPRPQIDVPGFEGILTCCADWPQTKKGGPPSAQSAIFNPLLACTLGYIPNHCTEEQVEFAMVWWSEVFPAFPRWVQELRAAGLTIDSVEGRKLMDSISVPKNKNKGKKNNEIDSAQEVTGAMSRPSNTNNLIFKHPKDIYGDVPHFKGRAQNHALELSPMTAVEVYACVTCVYSLAAY